jgi:hypothetical protein
MDPGSVVREGEQALINNSSPIIEQFKAGIGKQVFGGGTFTDEQRANLRNEITQKVRDLNRAYNVSRSDYERNATGAGLNPSEVLGTHMGEAFLGPVSQAQKERGVAMDSDQAPMPVSGAAPGGPSGGTSSPIPPGAPKITGEQASAYAQWQLENRGRLTGESINAYLRSTMGTEITNADEVAKYVNRTGDPVSTFNDPDASAKQRALEQQRDTLGGGVDALGRGIADVATFGFADEIAAGLNTAFDGGTYQDNLQQQQAIDAADQKVNPWLRGAGQLGGALALPFGAARGVGGMAKQGAAFGGAYGFGSTNGDLGDRIGGAATGAALGGAGGAAFGVAAPAVGRGLNALMSRGGSNQQTRNALLQDFQQQGITALPANVGGEIVNR